MRRLSITTWIVLGLCVAVGVAAVVITTMVVIRLNRQIIASAAELRAGISGSQSETPDAHGELAQYAAQIGALEAEWGRSVAELRLRYPDSRLHESVATARTVQALNAMRRPAAAAALHERLSQAWSDRDAAISILSRPAPTDADRARATDLARRADDELRRVRNELRDLLTAHGLPGDILPAAPG